jgi:hypothetical protein
MQSKGWHSRGYLPHFDSPETVQFVTFRLADSLPKAVVDALRMQDDFIRLIDERLDAGVGACCSVVPISLPWFRKRSSISMAVAIGCSHGV